jgi:hypothetical protein
MLVNQKQQQPDRPGNLTSHIDGLCLRISWGWQKTSKFPQLLVPEPTAQQLTMGSVRLRSFALQGSPHGVRAAQNFSESELVGSPRK